MKHLKRILFTLLALATLSQAGSISMVVDGQDGGTADWKGLAPSAAEISAAMAELNDNYSIYWPGGSKVALYLNNSGIGIDIIKTKNKDGSARIDIILYPDPSHAKPTHTVSLYFSDAKDCPDIGSIRGIATILATVRFFK